jgi:hypothetical protein
MEMNKVHASWGWAGSHQWITFIHAIGDVRACAVLVSEAAHLRAINPADDDARAALLRLRLLELDAAYARVKVLASGGLGLDLRTGAEP